jgi:hypothetical protein
MASDTRLSQLCLIAFALLLALLGFLGFRSISSESEIVQGEVRDANGPVERALVRIKGQADATQTDAEGRFRLAKRGVDAETITAWKDGYFIAGKTPKREWVSVYLRRLPIEDNDSYSWVDPTPSHTSKNNCGNCHAEMHREWATSGHASAATNRHFLSLYKGTDYQGKHSVGWSLRDEYPEGVGVCTACHAPTVPHGDPAYFDLCKTQGVARQGVHCDYCHKIADAGLGTIGLTHGRFGLQLLRPAERQLFFGPLDDVDRGEDAYSPLYKESRYCASCHEGTVFGVHVYGTYSEWLASPARKEGKQCQTCHMRPTGTMTNIAPRHGGIERDPNTLANHRFFAGSQLDMLRHAIHVSVSFDGNRAEHRLTVELRAEDVGHRMPTGFIDRNLVLIVEPLDANGKRLAMSEGPILPSQAGKSVAGLPGRIFGRILKDDAGTWPVPFWRADEEKTEDTRLKPGQADRVQFTLHPNAHRLRVLLLHRRSWPEVADVKGWPDNEMVIFDQILDVPL